MVEAKHFILAEKHRNIRCQGGVRPTDDGPELWCALCETRFDRPHSKREVRLESDFKIRVTLNRENVREIAYERDVPS